MTDAGDVQEFGCKDAWHGSECPTCGIAMPIEQLPQSEVIQILKDAGVDMDEPKPTPTWTSDEHVEFVKEMREEWDPKPAPAGEGWEMWVVETKHSYFIYEDETTAAKECASQAAYGQAEFFRVIEYSAFEQMRKTLEFAKSHHAYEVKLWGEKVDQACAERDEALARPPTFIKMDEASEAFVQTRAAIENMKLLQRDVEELKVHGEGWRSFASSLQSELAAAKGEIKRLRAVTAFYENEVRYYTKSIDSKVRVCAKAILTRAERIGK